MSRPLPLNHNNNGPAQPPPPPVSPHQPGSPPGHTIRRLSDDDVRAIFECLHHCTPLPERLEFTIVPVGPNGLKLSPPSYEFEGKFVPSWTRFCLICRLILAVGWIHLVLISTPRRFVCLVASSQKAKVGAIRTTGKYASRTISFTAFCCWFGSLERNMSVELVWTAVSATHGDSATILLP